MSLVKLGNVRRDVNTPLVWRSEHYAEESSTTIADTNYPGTLLIANYTVTIYENSRIRVHAVAWMSATDDDTDQHWGELCIYEGAGGVTLRDSKYATCQYDADIPDRMRNSCACLYEGSKTGAKAGTSYVFEIRGRASVANHVKANDIKWCIDVCRS